MELTQAQIDAYVAHVQSINNDHYRQNFARLSPPKIEAQIGPRYVRIVKRETVGVGCSVHTFLDRTNGDILKAAGFKSPAKNGVRGNVNSADFATKITHHGAAYLR